VRIPALMALQFDFAVRLLPVFTMLHTVCCRFVTTQTPPAM
jgi:hypothetical protein